MFKSNNSIVSFFSFLFLLIIWINIPSIHKYKYLLFYLSLILILITGLLILIKVIINKRNKLNLFNNIDISTIDNMSGLDFERYIAGLLKNQGYTKVRLTEKYDLGVDIIAIKNNIRYGIQVKRYSGLVKANAVRQVITALRVYNCDKAIVITNSYYSKTAIRLAKYNDCLLVGRDGVMKF